MLPVPARDASEVEMVIAASANGERSAGSTGKAPRPPAKSRAAGGKAKARRASKNGTGEPAGHSNGGAGDGQPRLQIVNAITAILLHAEVVRRQADGADDIAVSSGHIADNARRLWRVLGEPGPREARQADTATDAP